MQIKLDKMVASSNEMKAAIVELNKRLDGNSQVLDEWQTSSLVMSHATFLSNQLVSSLWVVCVGPGVAT